MNLLGLRHQLRILRFDISRFEPSPLLEAERCCLCNQYAKPRIAVKTQGRWGMWADRYLCGSCTAIAAHVDRSIAMAEASVSAQKPVKNQQDLTPVEQKHKEVELAVLEAIYAEEKPLSTAEIFKWLDRRNRYHSRSYIKSACTRLRDCNILQVEIGPHKAYVWAIAAQDREVAA